MHSSFTRRGLAAVLLLAGLLVAALSLPAVRRTGEVAEATGSCLPDSAIQHVIYLQFDNTHFSRDKGNVPSDLEQMPHLLSFLTSNGTLFANDHTILISHTGGGILSTLTGLYPDRTGQPVSNSYRYFTGTGSTGTNSSSSFKYWTDLTDDVNATPLDATYNMVTDGGKNTPAPWVPFTRAGCDVGGVGVANLELENTATTPHGDITSVFGSPSAEATEATSNSALAQTDFVGIAIHCAAGGGLCNNSTHAKTDALPDEPGGYTGFKGLFGAKYVNPVIAGGACVNDTLGQQIKDPSGNCGFPGFDSMEANVTLGYAAQMQEAGVPVTFAYISDAHDKHTAPTYAYGPGESGYRDALKSYDDAFNTFFTRLAAHGINKSNTLFVVTVDEGDHFAGGVGQPQPDGSLLYSHTNCAPAACPTNAVGEVNLNLGTLFNSANEPGITYTVHSDSAPTWYVVDSATKAALAPTEPKVRKLEKDVLALKQPDPFDSDPNNLPVVQRIVDPVGERALHMMTADPKRTPTFTTFQNPDFFSFSAGSDPACPVAQANPCVEFGFAWNHGDIQDEIGSTWLGLVGPGIENHGVDRATWTDHTNVRPTMLSLLGLQDDYVLDGRVLVEALATKATPHELVAHRETVLRLGDAYEQLNASFGQFSQYVLVASTKALAGDDATYTSIESSIDTLTTQRNTLAAAIRGALNGAAFGGQALNEQQAKSWIDQANGLIASAHTLAGN